ncbi:MAG TPA: Crp/Fnr family transcriptional regulator [Geminicoccus sp.]|jgi:CRP-like cAMP-binding protein|uniref:Crp/Fnr family transcriptional regulator n=1 Tax=Geminicoccus sp. TaxID=2024832 RepID=UPI002E318AB9|nr:Crp/Fnr family transcriptional regulator [Geminicoccus sp.]HEX2528834.1 Crp/Fnr family transcriptional regulator [Geminicoccus sp.]
MSSRSLVEASPSGEATHAFQLSSNRLLATLNMDERQLLLPRSELVELEARTLLVESGDDVVHTYFPLSSTMISLVLVMEDGSVAEAATVGREGAVGGIISGGHKPSFARALVQQPGRCIKVETACIEEAKAARPRLHDLFARYADILLAQVLQSVACNALHSLDKRCCRWLLLARERTGSTRLDITQEAIAQMLGVQRTTVTRTIGQLAARGLVRQSRGKITILDLPQLEAAACECYGAVRRHAARVLPEILRPQDN